MPKLQDLVAFQRAVELTVTIYESTKTFPKQEMYGLTAQIRRAAIGVVSNIAEGQGRITYGERRQFFSQAHGSLFEVEAQAIVAQRLAYLSASDFSRINEWIQKTGRALIGLIRWVQKLEKSPRPRTHEPTNPATATPQ
ncbi:MAG TPA: four helix bundle protein, partial [Thermoanaerobaculia bacterium]|nr:four helix bundle protein [Thermoanaerobaculia bacterium]